jgi:hypothetical protein
VTSLWFFLSLKNDVNVAAKGKEYEKLFFCWHLEGHWRKEQDPDPLVKGTDPRDPDPYQNVTDPEHCYYVQTVNYKECSWAPAWPRPPPRRGRIRIRTKMSRIRTLMLCWNCEW